MLVQGATPTDSKTNLIEWLDTLVLNHSPQCTRPRNVHGNFYLGQYGGLRSTEWTDIFVDLATTHAWMTALEAANLSCGVMVVTLGGCGRGHTNARIGPFHLPDLAI